jgi:hypothetical protein
MAKLFFSQELKALANKKNLKVLKIMRNPLVRMEGLKSRKSW